MSEMFISAFRGLLHLMTEAFPDPRPRRRVSELAEALLAGSRPATITNALRHQHREQEQWGASYKLFSYVKWLVRALFSPIAREAARMDGGGAGPVFSAQDDTLIRKTGRTIPGTAYARDPRSPKFHVNLVLGQRFVQTSVMVGGHHDDHPWRGIPVGFRHTPPVKAGRKATDEEKAAVRETRKKQNLSTAAAEEIAWLREQIDMTPGGRDRLLINSVDGSYANKTYLTRIPDRTVAVARVRHNARLRAPLPLDQRRGNRKYGAELPTPGELLADPTVEWKQVQVFVAGELRTLKYKTIAPVCWPHVTHDKPLTLIVIKAAGYRLRKGSKLLYRQPAFLIATTTQVDVATLIRAYLARWEIEVNFRDEKTVFGVGTAQVWNNKSVERVPAFHVAAYACLLLASVKAFGDRRAPGQLPPLPKWRNVEPLRPSAIELLNLLRAA